MALSKIQKLGIASAFGALAMGINLTPANDITFVPAAQAQATQTVLPSKMAVGQCVSREAMLAGLKAEDQSILVAHDAKGYSNKTGEIVYQREVFTADPTLSTGYHITATLQGEFCKSAALANIRLLDGRDGKIDTRAYFQPANYSADGTLNASINAGFKNRGVVPMLQATAPASGLTITVIGNPVSGSGAVIFSQKNGEITNQGGYASKNSQYSPSALATLARPQQTASLDLAAR